MYFPLSVGASAVLSPKRPTPEHIFTLLRKFRPTVFFGIPTLYAQMLEYKTKEDAQKGIKPDPNLDHEFSSVRVCVSSGEALPPDIFYRWKERFGLEIIDGIGSTEVLHIFCSNRPGAIKPGFAGKPVPAYELKIVDEEGKEVPQGHIGTLLVKGESIAQQYWKKREKTRLTI